MDTWTHKFTQTKPFRGTGYGRKAPQQITVNAGLHQLQGNTRPYFSVTADIALVSRTFDPFACGCLHDEVVRYWPQLAPVIALHLSDDTGAPMYAAANGWYHLAGYYGGADERYHGGNSSTGAAPDACLQTFADHVRLPIETVRVLADGWRNADDWTASKRWYLQWIETQRARWQSEATDAVVLLDRLIAGA